jgi:uncharacterized protein (DUF433 family)
MTRQHTRQYFHGPFQECRRTWGTQRRLDQYVQSISNCRIQSGVSYSSVLDRALKLCPSISIDDLRQQGKPCIAGTRIPVHLVLWAVEQHGSVEGVLKSYPDLTTQQVKDALYFSEIVLGSHRVNTQAALAS